MHNRGQQILRPRLMAALLFTLVIGLASLTAAAAGGAGKQAGPADGAQSGLEILLPAAPNAVAIENGQADPRTGAPVALWRVNYPARGATPEAQARDYLSANAAALHLRSADLADLVFDSEREGPSGATVRFDQVAAGVPVYGAQIAVHISPAGLVTYVTSSYRPDVSLAEAAPALAPAEARQAVIDHLGASGAFRYDQTPLAVYPDSGGRLVYVVRIVADQPMGDWEALVDAHSGALLQVADRYLDVDGTGNVFDPDPLSSSGANYGDPGFVDNNDATSPQLDGERVSKTLLDITFDGAQYTLVGPYAEIRDSEAPFYGLFPEADGVWDYNRFDNGFEAAHTYYHIDAFMRYINETLGIALAPIQYPGGARFDAHGLNGADNSHYSSATGEVAFGEGGVDDAEDADVVIHELGHGIHDWVTNGNLSQVQGLSEGTGDYVAASYSRSFGQWSLGDPQYYWVFDWDGHNPFWPGRVTNWPAHYPEGLTGQIHTDGQIWSTSLMRIWDDIGGERIDAAVLEGLGMTGASTNQEQAANAVMQAAIDMGYTTPELQAMYDSFTTTGYNVPPPTQVAPEIEVDPDALTQTLAIGATATQGLDIINSGDADLTWEIIEEAPAAAPAAPPASPVGSVERLGPTPPDPNPAEFVPTDDVIQDGGFEAGSPNPFWTEFSTNFFTPLCTIADCGVGGGTGPRSGTWWAWFGGIEVYEEGSVSQDVIMPEGTATLSFWLEVPVCDSAADYLEVLIDGTQVFVTDGDDPLCGVIGYSEQTVDVSAWADGGTHNVEFHSEIFASGGDLSNFFVDDVVLDVQAGPGPCAPGDIPWVSADPTSGTAAAGETDTVDVTFDATGLTAGVYTGTLCVASNDEDEPIVTVPLTLTVEEAPPGYNLFLPVAVNAATGQAAGGAPIAPAAALLAPLAALFVRRHTRR